MGKWYTQTTALSKRLCYNTGYGVLWEHGLREKQLSLRQSLVCVRVSQVRGFLIGFQRKEDFQAEI